MAELFKEIEAMKELVVEDYYRQELITNQFMGRNFTYVLRIQKMWKMQQVKKEFNRKKYIIVEEDGCHTNSAIYERISGIKVRKEHQVPEARRTKHRIFQFPRSNDPESVIGHFDLRFRGYRFRKYVHSYYHRKKCLKNIKKQVLSCKENLAVKKMMQAYVQEQDDLMKVESV
jgi:hypothetical protein